jgi:uncharacterized protein with PQ loop repeat
MPANTTTEERMSPESVVHAARESATDLMLRRLMAAMSVFTLAMTLPQVLTIWIQHQAAGVSVLTWSAYLASAALWFWYGLRKRDKSIYLPCIGWLLMDGAVVAGVVIYA